MKTQLNEEISMIGSEKIRSLVRATLDAAPDCFWTMPAATTGKYHPSISLGEGGLIRHTRAVVRITRHLLDMIDRMNPHPAHDICVAAAILHDCCKKRDAERYTAFDHPLRAADLIAKTAKVLNDAELLRASADICEIVARHMGRWNTDARSGLCLPRPETAMQRLVHTADFLSSRKDIIVDGLLI